jgi:hypothetical protein
MKTILLGFFLLTGFFVHAQKIGGFYSGTLYNDSTKMVQQYELALSEYKGKITGYSYVTFVIRDTFYYGIRKVKATIEGDSLIVQDDKIILNNFPESPARRIGRIITIPLKGQDSLVTLDGTWRTNKTRIYYSVPGSIVLNRSSDSSHSPLIAHLQDLDIIPKPQTYNYAVAETKVKVKENKVKTKTGTAPPVALVPAAPIPYGQRKTNRMKDVEISSDSLVLTLYDNGVVDGDSISVYSNGKNVVSNRKLSTTAIKKTLYFEPGNPELKITLVAENLGTIPPNTGLVMIRDGEQDIRLNFSADLSTNAEIIIRKKSK